MFLKILGLGFRGTSNLNAKYMLEYSSSLSFHERVANLNVSERKRTPTSSVY